MAGRTAAQKAASARNLVAARKKRKKAGSKKLHVTSDDPFQVGDRTWAILIIGSLLLVATSVLLMAQGSLGY